MHTLRPKFAILGLAALICAVIASAVAPPAVSAQIQQGATMTVLRGQVAIIRQDGSADQPAPSGATVQIGDEIRTVGKAGALITFFSGTEVELGEDTSLVVEDIEKDGDRISVSLRQAFGASLHRVSTISGSDSLYRVEAGGAVALVRGTTFAVIGPSASGSGNAVVIVCLEDCGSASTFANCPLMPFSAIGVTVDHGQVEGSCETFAASPGDGYFNAGDQALTAMSQPHDGDDDDDDDDDDEPNGSEEEEDDDCDYGE